MALSKTTMYKDIVCNYHKIWSTRTVFAREVPNSDGYRNIIVEVALYKDVAQREASVENYLRLKTYRFIFDEGDAPVSEKVEKVYKALKKLSDFEGAVDA